MLANFRAFFRHTNNERWQDVINASQNALTKLQTQSSLGTGLISDFIEPESVSSNQQIPAAPYFLEGQYDGGYYYNACRVPLRIGMDALLYNDGISRQIVTKISTWMEQASGGNPYGVNAGYSLEGTPVAGGNYFSTAFVAPLGVAAMNDANQQYWLNDIYESVHNTHQGYYEDSINLLSLLVMTGNYWSV
jgi:hypothetical protein